MRPGGDSRKLSNVARPATEAVAGNAGQWAARSRGIAPDPRPGTLRWRPDRRR